jgi:hypothetical protein
MKWVLDTPNAFKHVKSLLAFKLKFLLLRKLALEMAFNIFTAQRVSCIAQYDRIDDLIPCKLRGDKCPVFREFLVDEFHFSTVFKCFDPLFVWHFRTSPVALSALQQSPPVGMFQKRFLNATSIDRRSNAQTTLSAPEGRSISDCSLFRA